MSDAEAKNNKGPNDKGAGPTRSFDSSVKGPGGQVGPYKLLSILGEGGYGIVYLAERQRPVKRRVALKVIKPGMDTKEVIARFEAERQALALLEHPNIAHVFNAGTTEMGRPYFVMEYVKGVPITEHCDRHKLTIEERLNLFLRVCEAVQYAHQKGIIHRDIKPSNIQVSIQGEQVVPKVIDFGVAKAISQPLTERTLVTEQGQFIGTPEYMSPEQAEITGQDVDTRSDIYSLGAVLYELLTGVLPFDAETLREGGVNHIRYMIREEEPKTPSIRLKTISGEESRKVAKLRRTDIRTLGRKLHGDLDWITIKAMEKDRTRRYQTAHALAEDIQRHLNHEPVLAGPPSTMYRLKKFVRRHRHSVTAAAVVIVSLVLGFIVSTVMYVQARQAREKEAAALSEAQAVADFLTNDLLASVYPEKAKSPEVTVRYVLEAASRKLEGKFEGRPIVEAAIHEALGLTYKKLGDYKAAEPHLIYALEIRREQLGDEDKSTLTALSELGWLYVLQSRFEDAEPLLVETLEIRNRVLGEEHPGTLESMCELGWQYLYRMVEDRFDRAEALFVKVMEIGHRELGEEHAVVLSAMRGLALRYICVTQFDEAWPLSKKGLEISRRVLGKEHEVTLDFMNQLAWVYGEQGRTDEAVELAIEALQISQRVLGDEHPVTLESMNNLGWLYSQQGRYDKATKLLSTSVELSWRVLGDGHLYTLLFTIRLVALYDAQGQYDKMDVLLVKTLESSQRMLGEEHLLTGWFRSELTERTRQLGLLGIKQYHTGEYESALETFTRLEALCRTLNNEPSPSYISFMSMALHQLGHDQEAKTALARLRRLVEDNKPAREEYLYEAEKLFVGENSRLYLVWECIEAGKLNEASELIEQLRSLPHKEYTEIAGGVVSSIKALARAYYNRGKSAEGRDKYTEAISDYEAAFRVDPSYSRAYDHFAWLLATCQANEFRDGARAIESATNACEIARWKNHNYVSTLAAAYAEAGDYKTAIKRQKEAIDLLTEDERSIWQVSYASRLVLYQSGKPYHYYKGIIGWWKLDEDNGNIAADSSGNNFDGKLLGKPQWVAGQIDGALAFDGINDYIDCGRDASFDITDEITLSVWVKTNDSGNGQHNPYVCKGNRSYIIKHFVENLIEFDIYDGDWYEARYPVDSSFNGVWHHLAGTYDGRQVKLYIDGVLQDTADHVGSIDISTYNVNIGRNSEETNRFYKGVIDDVRIYNYALSEAEIKALCAGEVSEPTESN